jgi:acetyl-CoA C-acetyltransferase
MMIKSNPDDILIAGLGITPVGEHWDKQLRTLALEAISAARQDAGELVPEAIYVANSLAPVLSSQTQLGALVADFAGLRGVEAYTIQAAEASGGAAVRQAYLALQSGRIDVALVVGVEKISERPSAEVEDALVMSGDADYEAIHGVTTAAQAALLMQRYMYEFDLSQDAFAGFCVNAHANGANNPMAMFQRAIDENKYAKAPMLCSPVNMFDAAPIADGAAALVLIRAEIFPETPSRPQVRIAASSQATSTIALHDRQDLLTFNAASDATNKAYALAGVQAKDVQVFELHDRFSIFAALSLEACGFAQRGEGWKLAKDGSIRPDGSIPICTFGGSKARGDSCGATGVYQIAELCLQLQGRAGKNQVPDVQTGMAQCLGGTGATAATHILQRIDGS